MFSLSVKSIKKLPFCCRKFNLRLNFIYSLNFREFKCQTIMDSFEADLLFLENNFCLIVLKYQFLKSRIMQWHISNVAIQIINIENTYYTVKRV